mmetsp:Transcript_10041/g.16903  ORF Transcript_10041/g.16903 Transcript_10041/m.16903 type:complete len:96 (-) Transcript_10041:774-1061(-)
MDIRSRTIDEHFADQGRIERANLKSLAESNLHFIMDVQREKRALDLYQHKKLQGKLVLRQGVCGMHVKSALSLGVAGFFYAYFPMFVGIMGASLT